jgi:anti-sigma regulatory factor (Ser/Thr protein kinase)
LREPDATITGRCAMISNTTAPAASAIADTAVHASLTVPCEARHVRAVRDFVGKTLGHGPCPEIPILLASELATNSVRHSSSRLGGDMTVTVSADPDGTIRIGVADAGGLSMPVLRSGRNDSETGRGLHLVDDLSAQWGYQIEPDGGLNTWFEVRPAAGTPTDQHLDGMR